MANKPNYSTLSRRQQFSVRGLPHGIIALAKKEEQAQTNLAAEETAKRGLDGKLNEFKLYRMFKRFDERLNFIPAVDVLQTIRTEMIKSAECRINDKVETAYSLDTVRGVMRAIHRLLFDFGYSRNPRNAKHLRRGGKEFRFRVNAEGTELPEPDPYCVCGYGSAMPQLCECGLQNKEVALLQRIEKLYETHSIRQICDLLGVNKNRVIEKAFHKCFPKNPSGKRGGHNKNGKKVANPEPCWCENCGQIQAAVMKQRQGGKIYIRNNKKLFCPQCGMQTRHWRMQSQPPTQEKESCSMPR